VSQKGGKEMTQKCPCCGAPLVFIDDMPKCLACRYTKPVESARVSHMLTLNQEICTETMQALLDSPEALSYCYQRGITQDTIEKFCIGYVPCGYRRLSEMWAQRILFPIMSSDGKDVVAFGGRKITVDDRAKYVNSPSSAIYSKSTSLYGYHLIPEHTDTIYVCEGFADTISASDFFQYPVSVLGTALTIYHAKMLRQKAQNIVMCFDADESGQKNILRALPMLAHVGFKPTQINVMLIEGAKDIDEALKKGKMLQEVSLFTYLKERKLLDMYVSNLLVGGDIK
jgi:DNA primase